MNILLCGKELDSAQRTGVLPYKKKEVFYILLENNVMFLAYVEEWDEDYCCPKVCASIGKKDLREIEKKIKGNNGYEDLEFISLF